MAKYPYPGDQKRSPARFVPLSTDGHYDMGAGHHGQEAWHGTCRTDLGAADHGQRTMGTYTLEIMGVSWGREASMDLGTILSRNSLEPSGRTIQPRALNM